VRVIRTGTDHLEVQGLDAINGTPVLDIKPYYSNSKSKRYLRWLRHRLLGVLPYTPASPLPCRLDFIFDLEPELSIVRQSRESPDAGMVAELMKDYF